ncbi:MAG: hypothetical protein KF819_09445 [Labilithrix sp.]|nr:hypothetical protein [Labilithrix sp.]
MISIRGGGAIAVGVALIIGLGCSSGAGPGGDPSGNPPGTTPGENPPPGVAGPTPIGVPTGDPTTAKIGAAGGTLESADKRVKIVVPPGALASDVELKMTPITNETPLGLGYAVRLEPDGTTFATPAKLVFAYEAWGTSTVPELLLGATQGPDRIWKTAGAPVLDAAAKTLTVDLPHFSDWSLSTCGRLTSTTYVLVGGQEANLAVEEQCETPSTGIALGGVSRTSLPVSWKKGDRQGNPGPGTLTPNGSTATLVAPQVGGEGDPMVRVTAEWSSRSGTRVVYDDIATRSHASFAVDGKSVIGAPQSFVQTLQGKTSVNIPSQNGSLAVGVRLSGVGSATTQPLDGFVTVASVGETSYHDTYLAPCGGEEVKFVTSTVSISHASAARQWIVGTVEGTVAVDRGEISCPPNGSPTTDVQFVPVSGAFYALWINHDQALPGP